MSTTASPAVRAPASPPDSPPAVSVSGVSKAFRLPHERYHTLKERILHPLRGKAHDVLRAVDDVSVDIRSGEFFGVVGRNGSGKSTLLKCIAGIYDIDQGDLLVRGRLSPFIELGVGFNMDLTARDNVLINAIMLGLSRKQARERFDQIIAFAELENFVDLKLKNYSSGMSVRLAFSVAIQVEAEILLIDEVLAVGDAAFQKKCFDEFERLKREGRTILFVTHDMGTVERFCDRAMLLDKGRMVAVGEPAAIARRYIQLNFGQTVHELSDAGTTERPDGGERAAEILEAWFEDHDRMRIAELAFGQPCEVCIEIRFKEDLADPVFGATLRNQYGATVFASSTAHGYGATGHFRAGTTAVVRMQFENWLAASRYAVTPSIARDGDTVEVIDVREDVASLVIYGGPFTGGVAHLPHSFEIDRL
jgi:ABC-type polysaccharide/polyol phosphate transport system ATPase subunit